MQPTPHIFVIDDDRGIRELLAEYLEKNGYRSTSAASGDEALSRIHDLNIDLIVLDLMMPGMDGLEFLRRLRANSNLPVIMLTARGEETDRIVGLEMGADDYLAKPFSPRELLARIKSVLRRSAGTAPQEQEEIRFNGWILNTGQRLLRDSDGGVVELSGGEFDLLLAMASRPNRILSRDQLVDLTRGRDAAPFDRSIDMQISRLRKHLRDSNQQIIQTVRGRGYVFSAPVEKT